MGAQRTQYQIVGRYMDGKEVVGYHLMCLANGKGGKYTREQVCYLVGRDQVTNCSGQIYQDKVLLRGTNGCSLDSLPVQYENSDVVKNADTMGHIHRNESIEQTMEKVLIVGRVKRGSKIVGFTIQNAGGAQKDITREQLVALIKENKVGNARMQSYQGRILLRGINCNLDELPCKQIIAE